MHNYAKFSFDLDFAGLSPRRIPLSIKRSAGPAGIGSIPWVPAKPRGWTALPDFAEAGLAVTTAVPRLAFFGIKGADWRCRCTTLCIHPHDLAPIVEIDPPSKLAENEFYVEKLAPAMVDLLARHPQEFKLIPLEGRVLLRAATTLRLSRSDWVLFNRHIFSGSSLGTVMDTTPIVDGSPGLKGSSLKLPGHSMDEVKARWGIDGGKLTGYDRQHLYFASVDILDEHRLSRLVPNAIKLKGRCIDFSRFNACYRQQYYMVALEQADAAGIVPEEGVLYTDPTVEEIWFLPTDLQAEEFKAPVVAPTGYREDPAIVCPRHLIPQFLIPARKAVRDYTIPHTVQSFRVRTTSVSATSDKDPAGKYYRLTDLHNLPKRDLRRERAERLAREQRLLNRYGNSLPDDFETLTDEEIDLFIRVGDLVKAGEFIEATEHPLLPRQYGTAHWVKWLQEAAPDLVVTCPVTKTAYIRRLADLEELVNIPGFWKTFESAYGEWGSWLKKLIICPAVQQAALISAI